MIAQHVDRDTLQQMRAAVLQAMLALAFAYEDNGKPDVKNGVLSLRKQLIDVTGGRWAF